MAVTINASTSAGAVTTADTSGVLQLQTGGTTALTVDASQNVGIGTSSPDCRLMLQTPSGTACQLNLSQSAVTNYRISIPASTDALTFVYGASTERARIDSSGNVGIGMTPTNFGNGYTVLQVANASNGGMLYLTNTANAGGRIYGNGAGLTYDAFSTTVHAFNTNGTERVRIDSSGNLGIGTSAPSTKLYVDNVANNTNGRFDTNFNNFTSVNVFSVLFGINTNTTSCSHFNGYADGANRILIFGNGNIQNQNNSYAGISDIKLKENVTDVTPKLNKLNQVRVVNYNLKDSPEQKLLGVIAQELEQIFPGMVEETADKDVDGNDLGTTTKSVKYSVFVPMLIKAIQEQQTLITQQAEAITALTTRITALEGAAA